MKKIFLCVTSLLVCCLLAFTACGGKKPNNNGGNSGGNNGGGEQNPVYEFTLSESELNLELTHTANLTATFTADGKPVDGTVEWSSDNAAVTVTDGAVTAEKAGSATVKATCNGLSAECKVNVKASYKPSLEIGAGDAERLSVMLGGEYVLQPYVTYDGARFDDGQFEFACDDDGVVTVDDSGKLSGVAVGTANLTVTGAWRGYGSDCLAAVYPVSVSRNSSVRIVTPETTVISSTANRPDGYSVPNSVQLTAKVISDGKEVANPTLVWGVSDSTVATVENGLVTGKSAGKVTVSVTYTDGEGAVYAAVPVTITVEFPCIDKTAEIDLGEIDASDAYDVGAGGLTVSNSKVFGNSELAITQVYEVRGDELIAFNVTSAPNGDGVITESGNIKMTARRQVWEIRNADYGYRVSVFVITRVIHDAQDLMTCFNIRTTGSTNQVFYGSGSYYVLAGNIDAKGTKRSEDNWTNDFKGSGGSGFAGEFDGRGYTVNGLTLQNGGLFGNLAPGSVIKNFALTDISFTTERTNGDYQPAPIAYSIYGNAVVENVFLQITSDVSPINYTSGGPRGLANMVRGSNQGTKPTVKNVVIKMDVGGKAAANSASALTRHQSGNYASFENVHIISDYAVVAKAYGGDKPEQSFGSGLTRYGARAEQASFAEAYAGSENVLADSGLDGDYWTYIQGVGYPVFTTYANNYLNASVTAAFNALPSSITVTAGESYTVPSDCCLVDFGGSYNGISFNGNTLTASDSVADGSFTLTVTSKVVSSATASINVTVVSKQAALKNELAALFGKLNGKTYEYNVGTGGSWDITKADVSGATAEDFGEITLAFGSDELSGVEISGSTVTISAQAQSGTVKLTVTSVTFGDVSATVDIAVLFKTTRIDALTELSKDAADGKLKLDYSGESDVAAKVGVKLAYRAEGESEWTAAADGAATFEAGKAALAQDFVNSLSKTGKYEFRVQAADAMAEFANVYVYTDIITDVNGLKAAFEHRTTSSKHVNLYGSGTYYVLGGNIDATGFIRAEDSWSGSDVTNSGFEGIFDGKGYTINGATLQNGGLFGSLAAGSVIKNFALTNVTLHTASAGNQAAPLAYHIYGDAKIENVFIQINGDSTEVTYTNGPRGLANMVKGSNTGKHPAFTNVVVYMNVDKPAINGLAASALSNYDYGNYAVFNNVHVISDYKLLRPNASKGNVDSNGVSLAGATRYGIADESSSFKEKFKNSADVLKDAKLGSDMWTYDAVIGYPVFTSYYNEYHGAVNDSYEFTEQIELSKDADDKMTVIDYSADSQIAREVAISVSCRTVGGTEEAIPESEFTAAAGKITLSADFMASLTAAGINKYEFSARTQTKTVKFGKVTVYTDIITDWDEFDAAFGAVDNSALTYGENTYYVLGNNIDAAGKTKSKTGDKWIDVGKLDDEQSVGFMGIFDGRGYTINGASAKRGGMFGYVGTTAEIKNVALTNLKLVNTGGENEALFFDICGAATVENVFVHIADISAVPSNQNIFGVANAIRSRSNHTQRATLKNIVLVMPNRGTAADSGKITAAICGSRNLYGNSALAENVYVISDNKLYNGSDAVSGTSAGTAADLGGGITRFGSGADKAAFAEAFADAQTALTQSGLTASCWTYGDSHQYPVFVSSAEYLTAA